MYRTLCTQFYDLDKPSAPQEELDLYLQFCEPGVTILEAMCGTGRFLLPILARGFAVEGVDASPEMLAVCKEKANDQGLTPRLYQQRLQELALQRTYDRIIIPAASFGLVTEAEQISASLGRLYEHLVAGGQLIMEVEPLENRPQVFGSVHAAVHERSDGAQIVLWSFAASYDAKEQVAKNINRYDLVEDGRLVDTEYEDFSVRYHDKDALAAQLNEAGFVVSETITLEETVVFVCLRS